VQRLAGAALESAERARTLIQRLLAFARRQPLQPRAVDVAALIADMAGLIASTSGPQIKVRIATPSGLPPALADANQLEMAILNLSVNARDAMPDGGMLTLAAREALVHEGRFVALSVSDTGIGMDEATRERAIEPFFSTKSVGKGTGLGLSMVHGLASQLGGSMAIDSRVGLGTTVTLMLPLAVVTVEADASGQAPSPLPAAGAVLLVDDDDAVRGATRETLVDFGYVVTERACAEDALTLLREWRPDYLVTDHMMPGMRGADLARVAVEAHPGLRVLLVSGYADLDAVSADLPRLAKPFRGEELCAALAALG
jgi:CheY-like chemotaxis protein